MTAKVKIIRSVEYLQVAEDGEIDLKKSKKILADIAQSKQPHADYDILLDFRRAYWILSTIDIYNLVKELFNYDNVFRDKLAMLVLPGKNFDKSEFFKLCGNNRGLNIEIFSNYEDAVQWFYEG